MNTAAGETPAWAPNRRYGLHHAIVHGDTAYGAWRDGGLVMMDVSDRPTPKLITHRNWSPPFGGGTHNCLPLPDRNCWSWPTKRCSTIARTASNTHGCSTSANRQIRSAYRHSRRRTKPIIASKGGAFRPAQYPREPAGFACQFGHHLCDLSERRNSRLRHSRCISPRRSRRFCSACAHSSDGSPSEPQQGDSVLRCLGFHGWLDLQHRFQRRNVYSGVSKMK